MMNVDISLDPTLSTSLCFDRQDFAQKTFSAERFLVKCRLSGHPFERIRDDLRVLLRIVQSSMIELINQRYADFVNLSSNLAGLSSVISKLHLDVEECTSGLNDIASKINNAVLALDQNIDEKRSCLKEQQNLRRKIDLYEKICSLETFLDKIADGQSERVLDYITRLNYYVIRILLIYSNQMDSSELEVVLSSALSKYQSVLENVLIREIKTINESSIGDQSMHKRNLVAILGSFEACKRLDAAHACFLNEFVDGELRTKFTTSTKSTEKRQCDEFERLLNSLLEFNSKYSPYFDYAPNRHKSFVRDCLLTYLLNFLDERFSNLVFSIDAQSFRKSYFNLCKFCSNIYKSGSYNNAKESHFTNSGLIRMIFNKFNVDIYYQLRKKEIMDKLENIYSKFDCHNVDFSRKHEPFNLSITMETYDIMRLIWSTDESKNGLYLPCLISKCAELTLLVANRQCSLTVELKNQFSNSNDICNSDKAGTHISTKISPSFDWKKQISLLLYVIDDFRVLKYVFHKDWKETFLNIESTGSMLNSISSCFALFCKNADEVVKSNVMPWILARITKKLDKVSEIPRRYRWTRKEAPEMASDYVKESLEYLFYFADDLKRCSSKNNPEPTMAERFDEDLIEICGQITRVYAEKIHLVLSSVDKISSSLNRLKKGGTVNAAITKTADQLDTNEITPSVNLTDEDKIRLQLKLDILEYTKLLAGYGLNADTTILDNLLLENKLPAKTAQ